MNETNFRLYAGKKTYLYRSFEDAKEAAKIYMPRMVELRIEILGEVEAGHADWWAYEYENKEWAPS